MLKNVTAIRLSCMQSQTAYFFKYFPLILRFRLIRKFRVLEYSVHSVVQNIPCIPCFRIFHIFRALEYSVYSVFQNIPYIPCFRIFRVFRVLEYSVYSVFQNIPCVPLFRSAVPSFRHSSEQSHRFTLSTLLINQIFVCTLQTGAHVWDYHVVFC